MRLLAIALFAVAALFVHDLADARVVRARAAGQQASPPASTPGRRRIRLERKPSRLERWLGLERQPAGLERQPSRLERRLRVERKPAGLERQSSRLERRVLEQRLARRFAPRLGTRLERRLAAGLGRRLASGLGTGLEQRLVGLEHRVVGLECRVVGLEHRLVGPRLGRRLGRGPGVGRHVGVADRDRHDAHRRRAGGDGVRRAGARADDALVLLHGAGRLLPLRPDVHARVDPRDPAGLGGGVTPCAHA